MAVVQVVVLVEITGFLQFSGVLMKEYVTKINLVDRGKYPSFMNYFLKGIIVNGRKVKFLDIFFIAIPIILTHTYYDDNQSRYFFYFLSIFYFVGAFLFHYVEYKCELFFFDDHFEVKYKDKLFHKASFDDIVYFEDSELMKGGYKVVYDGSLKGRAFYITHDNLSDEIKNLLSSNFTKPK